MAAFEVIALDTATPQLRAPGASDTYTFPRAVELPLGTANGVLYLNGSKVVSSGSALTFDGTNLKVGSVSGATVVFPRFSDNSTVLWVRSNSAVNEIEIRNSSGGGENYLKVGNGYLAFGVDAGEQMRLTSTGLGIGTSSPGQKLDVVGKISTVVAGGGTHLLMGNSYATVSLGSAQNAGLDADMVFYTQTSTERMRLDSSGNVGIGTSSPSSTAGFTTVTLNNASSGGIIDFQNNGSLVGRIYNNSTNFHVYNQTANALVFGTNGTERARIDSSGNLGLGVTPSASWASGCRVFQFGSFSAVNENFGGYPEISFNSTQTGSTSFVYRAGTNPATRFSQTNGAFQWHTALSGTAGNPISFTQALTLSSNSPFLTGTNLESGSNSFAIGTTGAAILGFFTNNTERARITSTGNVVAGGSVALATAATDGFLYVPTCAGTPTGTPTAITGMAPIVVDTTNNKLYFYSGGQWRDAGP